jgi:hypothetical protein
LRGERIQGFHIVRQRSRIVMRDFAASHLHLLGEQIGSFATLLVVSS